MKSYMMKPFGVNSLASKQLAKSHDCIVGSFTVDLVALWRLGDMGGDMGGAGDDIGDIEVSVSDSLAAASAEDGDDSSAADDEKNDERGGTPVSIGDPRDELLECCAWPAPRAVRPCVR